MSFPRQRAGFDEEDGLCHFCQAEATNYDRPEYPLCATHTQQRRDWDAKIAQRDRDEAEAPQRAANNLRSLIKKIADARHEFINQLGIVSFKLIDSAPTHDVWKYHISDISQPDVILGECIHLCLSVGYHSAGGDDEDEHDQLFFTQNYPKVSEWRDFAHSMVGAINFAYEPHLTTNKKLIVYLPSSSINDANDRTQHHLKQVNDIDKKMELIFRDVVPLDRKYILTSTSNVDDKIKIIRLRELKDIYEEMGCEDYRSSDEDEEGDQEEEE